MIKMPFSNSFETIKSNSLMIGFNANRLHSLVKKFTFTCLNMYINSNKVKYKKKLHLKTMLITLANNFLFLILFYISVLSCAIVLLDSLEHQTSNRAVDFKYFFFHFFTFWKSVSEVFEFLFAVI